jgi:hypothetical protein
MRIRFSAVQHVFAVQEENGRYVHILGRGAYFCVREAQHWRGF